MSASSKRTGSAAKRSTGQRSASGLGTKRRGAPNDDDYGDTATSSATGATAPPSGQGINSRPKRKRTLVKIAPMAGPDFGDEGEDLATAIRPKRSRKAQGKEKESADEQSKDGEMETFPLKPWDDKNPWLRLRADEWSDECPTLPYISTDESGRFATLSSTHRLDVIASESLKEIEDIIQQAYEVEDPAEDRMDVDVSPDLQDWWPVKSVPKASEMPFEEPNGRDTEELEQALFSQRGTVTPAKDDREPLIDFEGGGFPSPENDLNPQDDPPPGDDEFQMDWVGPVSPASPEETMTRGRLSKLDISSAPEPPRLPNLQTHAVQQGPRAPQKIRVMSNRNPLPHALLDGVLGSSGRGSHETIVVTTPERSRKSPKRKKPAMSDAQWEERKALRAKVNRSPIGLQEIFTLILKEAPLEVVMEHLKTLCDSINLQQEQYPEDLSAIVNAMHSDRAISTSVHTTGIRILKEIVKQGGDIPKDISKAVSKIALKPGQVPALSNRLRS